MKKPDRYAGRAPNPVILIFLGQSYSFDLQAIRNFAFAERALAANLTHRRKPISMDEFKNFCARMPAMLRALVVGIPAGFLFDYLHTPIPWMIGPMVGVATLNLLGVKMHSPPYARQMGQVILGSAVSVGSSRVDLQACKLEYSIVSPK